MQTTIETCERTRSDNPNDTPMPTLPVRNPDYAKSDAWVEVNGQTWTRTGYCWRCNAAIYGLHTHKQRYAHECDPSTPLHHAVQA